MRTKKICVSDPGKKLEITDRIIAFSAPMVRAIVEGRKTQTRRPTKYSLSRCPYGKPGDLAFIGERWRMANDGSIEYESLCPNPESLYTKRRMWFPSFTMPIAIARVMVSITDIRKEQLHDITIEDIYAEGISRDSSDPKRDFIMTWDSIQSGSRGKLWQDNPYVWRIEFKLEWVDPNALYYRVSQ